MSGTLGDIIMRGGETMAQLPKMWSDIALNYAQIPTQQAQAEELRARAGYAGAQTTGQQISNEWNRFINEQAIHGKGQQGGQQQQGTTWRPPDTSSGYAPPQAAPVGGGGGGAAPIGESPTPTPNTQRTAYNAPMPASTALAMQTNSGYAPPGSSSLQSAGGLPAPNYGDGIFLGASTSEPVPPDQVPTITVRPQPPPNAPAAAPGARGTSGAPAIPAAPGQPQQEPQYPSTVGSPNGVYSMELGGVMVPSQMQTQYWQDIKGGKNATQAATEAVAKRNNYLLQVAIGADTPQAWSRAIEQEYDNGYLSQNDYHMLHQNFGARATVLRALQPSVTAQQDTDQLNRGYVPSPHGYVFSPRMHSGDAPVVTGQLPGPGGTMTDQRLTPAQIAQNADQPVEGQPAGGGAPGGGGGAPSPAVAAVAGVAPGPFADYAGVVHTHEGFKPTMGEFGWSPKTKVEQARLWAPQEVAGLTDQQIVAKQLSPQAEARMLQGFTANNSVTLQNAGIRPSAANLFMSHYIGPQGMINLNKVPPNMTMAEMERRGLLAPGTVANNPELQGNTTTGGFIDWAQRRAGNNTITPDNIDGRSADVGPGPGGTPGTPRSAAAPGGGGGAGSGATYQSAPQRAPGVTQIIENNIASDNQAVKDAHEAALAAHGAARTANDMRARVQPLKEAGAFGYGAEFRTNAASLTHYLTGLLGKDNDLQKKFDSWNFENQTDREAFTKEAINLATQAESAMPGVRAGVGLTALIGKGTPSLSMQGDTVKELLDRIVVGHQMTMDYANGLTDRVLAAQDKFNEAPWTNPYSRAQQIHDRDWNDANSIHNTKVYLAAANLINGKPKGAWDKAGLTDPQKAEAVAIARRADPSWVPVEGQY